MMFRTLFITAIALVLATTVFFVSGQNTTMENSTMANSSTTTDANTSTTVMDNSTTIDNATTSTMAMNTSTTMDNTSTTEDNTTTSVANSTSTSTMMANTSTMAGGGTTSDAPTTSTIMGTTSSATLANTTMISSDAPTSSSSTGAAAAASTTTTTSQPDTSTTAAASTSSSSSTTDGASSTAIPPPPTTTTTAIATTSAPNTTYTAVPTILPTWGTTTDAPLAAPLTIVLYFKPKVVPADKTMDVVIELMTFREILTTRFNSDLAEYMNLVYGSYTVTTFKGHKDGTFSTSVTFNVVYNTSAYIDRLKYYSSPDGNKTVPGPVFRRFDQSVRGAAVSGTTVEGAMLVKVDPILSDTYDSLCFIGQDMCQASYIVIVLIVVAVCAITFFALRALFNKWAKEAPTREQQFSQEGQGTEMSQYQQELLRQQETARGHGGGRMEVDADL